MTPFFIQDETPRVLRVPDEASVTGQANGTIGVAGITIGVPALEAGINDYYMMTGLRAEPIDATRASFTLQSVAITIKADASIHTLAKLLDVQLRNVSGEIQRLSSFMP
jgi:hypothetical protein